MTNTTRKRFLPVALVMAIAAVGVVAVVIALAGATPRDVQAHGSSPGDCSTVAGRAVHDVISPNDPCPSPNTAPAAGAAISNLSISPNGTGSRQSTITDADAGDTLTWTVSSSDTAVATAMVDKMGMVTVTGVGAGTATIKVTATDPDSAMASQIFMVTVAVPVNPNRPSAPTMVRSEALDNMILVRWNKPQNLGPAGAEIVAYEITRIAYTSDPLNPINASGGKTVRVLGTVLEYRDQGLGYNTTYSHKVRAINMYEIDDVEGSSKGPYSAMVTSTTATSGGLLLPELAPPGRPTGVMGNASCADSILVTWMEPADKGKVAPDTVGCPVCANQTPPHTGGTHAGIQVKPGTAMIVGYMVERKVNNGAWSTLEARITDTEYSDSQSLVYGNTYTYRITAVNNAGLYGESSTVTVTLTQPAAPQRPSSLVVNLEQDHTLFELQWDPPEDMATPGLWRTDADFLAAETRGDYRSRNLSYLVERQIQIGPDSNPTRVSGWVSIIMPNDDPEDDFEDYVDPTHVHLVTLPDGTTQYALRHEYSREGLMTVRTQEHRDPAEERGAESQDVRYRVSALVRSCNHSPWNQADEVEIPEDIAPEMPTNLMAQAMGATQVNLSWAVPADNGGSAITGYQVEYSLDGMAWFAMGVGNVTVYSHTGLTPNTDYYYRVKATNALGDSNPSSMTMATTESLALGSASGLSGTAGADSGTVQLSWMAGANSTRHYLAGIKVSDWRAGDFSNVIFRATTGQSSDLVTGLTSGEQYAFRVISGNADSWDATWSNAAYATPN